LVSEIVPPAPPTHHPEPETFHFDTWRFDARDGLLVGADCEVSLRPKTAGVLRELLVRAGEVVTKGELIGAVWGPGGSGDDALAVCVNELRRALGDDPRRPRFIATAHRRGYRFVATLTDVRGARGASARALHGRARELDSVRGWWAAASEPGRRVGVVAGELGIGKSALVRAFVDEVRAAGGAWVGEGQCLERVGEGDPYHPLLEALNGLCAGPRGARVRDVLAARAPSWAVQLAGRVPPTRPAEMRARSVGPESGRMLREFVDAMAELGAEAPVLLVIEDLHAADRASLELVTALARRGSPAGVFLLATTRTDASRAGVGSEASVVELLDAHGDTGVVELGPLSGPSVRGLLAERLGAAATDDSLVADVLGRTGGNPLYVAMLAEHLAGRLAARGDGGDGLPVLGVGIPDGLRRVVERRIAALDDDDRRLLEIAAVAGPEFTAAAVAPAVEPTADERTIEDHLSRLARSQGVLHELDPATWPDGTVTARFAFRHALHRDVLYARLGGARRVVAHRRIGERLAAAFADRPGPAATEIAEHFAHGRDAASAAVWFTHAAETAMSRQVPLVALAHAGRALELLDGLRTLPEGEATQAEAPSPALALLEGRVCVTRVAAAIVAWGVRSERAADEAARLDLAAARITQPDALGRIGYVVWSVSLMRGDIHGAERRLGRLVDAAEASGDDGLLLQAGNAQAITTLALGDPVGAREHLARASDHDSPAVRRRLAGAYQDSGVLLRSFVALDEWLLGNADVARRHAEEALALARAGSRLDGLCQALGALAAIHQLLGDTSTVRALADELLALAEANEVSLWVSAGKVMGGWAMIEDEPANAAESIRAGLAEVESVADGVWGPYHLSLLVEAETAAGRIAEATEVVDRAIALAEASGERWYLAELTRKRAGLAFAAARESGNGQRDRLEREADDLLERALDIARAQGAHALELRVLATIAARDLDRRGPGRWLRERSGA